MDFSDVYDIWNRAGPQHHLRPSKQSTPYVSYGTARPNGIDPWYLFPFGTSRNFYNFTMNISATFTITTALKINVHIDISMYQMCNAGEKVHLRD